MRPFSWVRASAALALVACGSGAVGGDPTFGTAPFATVTTDSGKLDVALYSSPDPIGRVSSVELVVTDAVSGAPVDALGLDITPWMPAMGHGASTLPVVVAKGDGVYVASDVVLAMPGEWQLRTKVSGTVDDTFVTTVEVP